MSLEDDLLPPAKPLKVRDPAPLKMVSGALTLARNALVDQAKQEQDADERERCLRAANLVMRAMEELR